MKIITPKPNWLGLTPWKPLYKEMTIVCCDCGLAHKFYFRAFKGKLKWRVKRDKQATKEHRKLTKST